MVPLVVNKPLMNSSTNRTRFAGREYIGFAEVNSAAPIGSILSELSVNPRSFLNTRLATQAKVWDKYRIKNFSIEATPSAPFTVGGSYMAGVDPDPRESYASMQPHNRLTSLSNVPGGGMFQVSQPCKVTLESQTSEWLFCNPSEEELYKTTAGVFAMALSSPLSGITGTITISLYIAYDIEFMGASIEEVETSALSTFELNQGPVSPTGPYKANVTNANVNNNGQVFAIRGPAESMPLPEGLSQMIFSEGYQFAKLFTVGAQTLAQFYQSESDAVLDLQSLSVSGVPAPQAINTPARLFVEQIQV